MLDYEKDGMLLLADVIKEEIDQMCAIDDFKKFNTLYRHAKEDFDNLFDMIIRIKFKSNDDKRRLEYV